MQETRLKYYLKAEAIIRFLEGKDEEMDTLIMCKSTEVKLYTTDQSIYEALASMKDRKDADMNRLVKLLEVTEVLSYKRVLKKNREVLTPKRAQELIDRSKEKIGGKENGKDNRD